MTNATATPAPRQRKKPARFARLVRPAADVLVLSLRTVRPRAGDTIDTYTLESIPADHGKGLLLHKHDGTSDTEFVKGLFEGYRVQRLENRREINLNSQDRDVTELLIMNFSDRGQCGTFGTPGHNC